MKGKKCNHRFHYVAIYYKSNFKEPFVEKRFCSFCCEKCGYLKEIEVRLNE